MKSAATDAIFLKYIRTGTKEEPKESEVWLRKESWYINALDDQVPVNESKQEKNNE